MTDSERINKVIEYTKLSASAFSKRIGLKSPDIIYHVQHNRNGISAKLADSIIENFPEISKGWLLTGEGDMLTSIQASELPAENNKAPISDLTRALLIIESQQESIRKMTEAALIQAETLKNMFLKAESTNDEVSKAG